MPIEWEKPTVEQSMQLGYEAFEPEIEEQEPSSLDIAASTLRIENPVSSWIESLNYQSEQEDVAGYDPYQDLPDEYMPYSESFLDVRSPDQSLMKQAQIDSQIKDREVMARGGAETVGWTLVAGMGDPINLPLMLIPGGAAVKAGVGAGKVAAVTAAGGVAEAGISEGILHATQPTRTWQESMYAVGGTALLGGALGGLAGAGTKRTLKALEDADKEIKDILDNGGPIDMDQVGTAGAQRVKGTLKEEGTSLIGPAISPLTRLLKSTSTSARNTVNRMLRHNFTLGKNKSVDADGNTQYKETSIPVEVETTRTQQSLAGKYLRTVNANHKLMKATGVKMKKPQFMKEVGRAMRRGDAHEIPEIAATAKQIRKDVINPVTKMYQELGELPDDLTAKYAKSYLPRVYDTKAIVKNMDRWLEMLTVHFTGKETSALEARALATDITDKILASPTGRMPVDVVGTSGHLKERVLNIRDEVLDEAGFLNDNIDDVMQTYLRSTVPEAHLKREFGDHELVGEIQSIKDEYEILIDSAKNNKERKKLRDAMGNDIRDISAMRDIMLGRYIPPSDIGKGLANMSRIARSLSFMANLGMMTISAIPDIARPIMQHGAGAWAKALPRSMLYWGKQTKIARKSLEEMGIGVDSLLNSRAYAIADIDDINSALKPLTSRFAKHSGMNLWNSTMKKVAAFTAQNRFINDSRNYSKLSGLRKERLAKAGINERMAKSIAEQSDKHGEKLGSSWHANTNDWTDREAANLFERVLLKDVDNTIITPGIGDKPLLMSTEAGKTILQFKTFFLAAHNQALIPLAQQFARGDMAAMQGIIVGISLGMMGEWIRLNLTSDERAAELEGYSMQDWARAGLDRSGIATVPMELINMTDRVLDGQISQQMGLMQGSRYFYRNILGSLLGPAAGYAENSVKLTQNLINSDGVSERDIHSIRRLMPYQNMFYLRRLITELEESVVKSTGVTPRKRRRGKTSGTYIQ
ncbi:MAG: hypothetical protein DRI97_06730 [Bacteroidetes bacterium]|nr:MAG: hypothetical protein DRI97_06730 [Bacteroidota bacterium]